MRALSLWQPHAEAIARGLKIWETRGWFDQYRGPLAIHAAKKEFRERDYPWEWFSEAKKRLSLAGCPLHKLDYGKVICVADVVDCVPTAAVRALAGAEMDRGVEKLRGPFPGWFFWGDFRDRGDDGKLRFAFKLENVRTIPALQRPPVVGRQGWFEVGDEAALWG